MSQIHWSSIVVTADRPGEPTLMATINSILDAGFPIPLVCVQQNSAMPESAFRRIGGFDNVRRGAESPGAYQNWLAALRHLVQLGGDESTRLLIFEDDIELSSGLCDYLSAFPPPRDGVSSLYSAAPNDESDSIFGWQPVRVPQRAYGALAYCFPLDLARRLLATALLTHKPHGTDHAVGLWCRDNGVPYYVHAPSFAIHRGENSSLPAAGIAENRQCRRWIESVSVGIERRLSAEKNVRVVASVVDLATGQSRLESVTRQADIF